MTVSNKELEKFAKTIEEVTNYPLPEDVVKAAIKKFRAKPEKEEQ